MPSIFPPGLESGVFFYRGGREFARGPREAFLKIEDIFSSFALGKITLDHAVKALNYARRVIIPKMGYPEDVKKELLDSYDEAVRLIKKLLTPKRVKEWLLSHGPPKREGVSLERWLG